MFENLSQRLTQALRNVTGQGRLSETNIQEALREVRMALLEADVALPVVKEFIGKVKERAIGQEVMQSLTPGQAMIKVVRDELNTILGSETAELNLQAKPPVVFLMAGLQGAGKTTSVAKLARYLKERQKKSVMVVSCDVYRPAAIKQLETVAKEVGAKFFPSQSQQQPIAIAQAAMQEAKIQFADVLIIDTAGRLHIDQEMMAEIQQLHQATQPAETLFVVDAMTGQDAARTAKAFHDTLPLTGVILTKVDGDARGGAALSVRTITGAPIKFVGLGEKTDALQPFHPDRMASRILGMGDVLTLIEDAEHKLDKTQAEKFSRKMQSGQKFDLDDFRMQLQQMRNFGGVNTLLDKLPGMGQIPQEAKDKINDKLFIQMEAMINSMTPQEREHPSILKGSRKKRIVQGSGTQIQDLNRMLKQFDEMQKMMKKLNMKGGIGRMMRNLRSILPPGALNG